jgi:hypothetical protein
LTCHNLKGFCAEVNSSDQPSRQLWQRTQNGYAVQSPGLKLRSHSSDDWLPWTQWLNQPLVFAGCGISLQGA